jgi:hypothetical protein
MSKQSHSIFTEAFKANGAVSEHRLVGFDGAQASVQGQKVAGVTRTDAADGEMVAPDSTTAVPIMSAATISPSAASVRVTPATFWP